MARHLLRLKHASTSIDSPRQARSASRLDSHSTAPGILRSTRAARSPTRAGAVDVPVTCRSLRRRRAAVSKHPLFRACGTGARLRFQSERRRSRVLLPSARLTGPRCGRTAMAARTKAATTHSLRPDDGAGGRDRCEIVVRAEDDPGDLESPRQRIGARAAFDWYPHDGHLQTVLDRGAEPIHEIRWTPNRSVGRSACAVWCEDGAPRSCVCAAAHRR